MSKSIVSRVRSMAKKVVDVRVYKCANQILTEMSSNFKRYLLKNNFPTVYNAKVLLVLDRNWNNYTFTEIQLACEFLGLHHEIGANKSHIIKMLPFEKGSTMSEAQKFYKILRPSVIEETKWIKSATADSYKSLDETQKARIKAKAYLNQILMQINLGNFSAELIGQDEYRSQVEYRITVSVSFPGKFIPHTIVQIEELCKSFDKHRFRFFDFDNCQCVFYTSTH